MLKEEEKKEEFYPTWVCMDCGNYAAKVQNKKTNDCATYHSGRCGVCLREIAVTEPRDFSFPDFKEIRGAFSYIPVTPIAPIEDKINHPKHYTSGKIEVIDAIEDWKLGFHRGNVIKYVARAGKKDAKKELEDLKKAQWYLNREIEKTEAKQNG